MNPKGNHCNKWESLQERVIFQPIFPLLPKVSYPTKKRLAALLNGVHVVRAISNSEFPGRVQTSKSTLLLPSCRILEIVRRCRDRRSRPSTRVVTIIGNSNIGEEASHFTWLPSPLFSSTSHFVRPCRTAMRAATYCPLLALSPESHAA